MIRLVSRENKKVMEMKMEMEMEMETKRDQAECSSAHESSDASTNFVSMTKSDLVTQGLRTPNYTTSSYD